MALPKPSYSFTIPSIHDDTLLDCRLYHQTLKPGKLSTSTAVPAAIVAHPYAPLGGSQDDPVVSVIGSILLKHGFIVGTFNFRGAGGSAGRTSWSAKLELADYVSFYGFMLAYLNGINVSKTSSEGVVVSSIDGGILILGGYSYGSLIAKSLPSLHVVREIFASPAAGSPQAEIVLRAQDVSKEYLEKHQAAKRSTRGRDSLRTSASLVVGGYESEATSKRMSREASRKSLDLEGLRKSVDRMRERPSRRASGRHDSSNSSNTKGSEAMPVSPRICYLLVSPLLAPITSFLSLSSKLKLPATLTTGTEDSIEMDQLLLHSSCCIYGHHDMFTSYKRLRKWAAKLRQGSENRFSTYEVPAAGHFWQEEGAEPGLTNAIEEWLCEL